MYKPGGNLETCETGSTQSAMKRISKPISTILAAALPIGLLPISGRAHRQPISASPAAQPSPYAQNWQNYISAFDGIPLSGSFQLGVPATYGYFTNKDNVNLLFDKGTGRLCKKDKRD
jgi:hypothetical protein